MPLGSRRLLFVDKRHRLLEVRLQPQEFAPVAAAVGMQLLHLAAIRGQDSSAVQGIVRPSARMHRGVSLADPLRQLGSIIADDDQALAAATADTRGYRAPCKT